MSFKNFINFKEKVFILIKFGTKYTFLWIEGPLWNFGSLAADGLKSHIRWTRLVIWAWICFFLLWVRLITWLLTFQILSANRVRLTRPTTSLSNRFTKPSWTFSFLKHSSLSLSSKTPWPKASSSASSSYRHHDRHRHRRRWCFLLFLWPTLSRFRSNPDPNVSSSSTLNATATKGGGFLFNHPNTNPRISPYSKIPNPKVRTPSLRSGSSRRRVGNGFKDWKF